MSDTLTQFASDLVAAWNAHDIERVAVLYAPEYEEVDVGQAAPQHGPESIRRTMTRYLYAFPDLQVTLNEVLVEGDRAALAWTWRGTHRGTLMNIPPTGRTVTVQGMSILTLEAGRIRRGLRIWDLAGLLRALGLLPEL